MNEYVSPEYLETIHRLALGIEFIDPIRERGLMHPVRVDIERGLPHSAKSTKEPYCSLQSWGVAPDSVCRHHSGRYALLYYPGIGTDINLRIYDHYRYFVPRRLRVPLLPIEEIEQPGSSRAELRTRHPVLFPGAAYDISKTATGLRGCVLRDGEPMRWAIIEATLPISGELVGRARGDDRGEFLLLLTPIAAPGSDISSTIDVRISVFGPVNKPVPANVELPAQDDLWDLPLEILPAPGSSDDVSSGSELPSGYTKSVSPEQIVTFQLGRIITGIEFVFP